MWDLAPDLFHTNIQNLPSIFQLEASDSVIASFY